MSKFVSGVLGAKFSPSVLLAGGLMATAAVNIAFGFGTSLAWFCFFWALNGTLQVGARGCSFQWGAWGWGSRRGQGVRMLMLWGRGRCKYQPKLYRTHCKKARRRAWPGGSMIGHGGRGPRMLQTGQNGGRHQRREWDCMGPGDVPRAMGLPGL